jgi:hypothetical protein
MSEFNTQVIDGKKYAAVERKAEVGDKVVINGRLFTVDRSYREGVYYYEGIKKRYCAHENYRVLDPLEQDVTDLLANLAHRVSSLEQQLSATQDNLEKLAEELASVKYIGECSTDDIIDLDQRLIAVEGRTQPQSAEVVTFEKFLDSIAEKVAQKLVGDEC